MTGAVIVAGGSLNLAARAISARFIEESGGRMAKLAIFPADREKRYTRSTVKVWEELGVRPENIVICDTDDFARRLGGVTGFWFSDGSMRFILKNFQNRDGSDTEALKAVRSIHEKGGAVGGSSAGAAVMSEIMIAGGDSYTALNAPVSWGFGDYSDETADNLRITKGFGFFPAGVTDRHFDAKPRFFRLLEGVMLTRDGRNGLGFGVSDDTAIVYSGKTGIVSVIGEGAVYIVDCGLAVRLGKLGAYTYTGVKLGLLNEGDTFQPSMKKYSFAEDKAAYNAEKLERDLLAGRGRLAVFDGEQFGQKPRYELTDEVRVYRFEADKYSFSGVELCTFQV